MNIKKLYKIIYTKIISTVNPLKYARKIGVNMGKDCHIYGKVYWGSEPWIITLGENVYITDGVKFITHDGGTLLFRRQIPDIEVTKPIVVGNNVYFGNNVIIMPGVTIGDNVVIGAGAVVTKDILPNSVAVGVPAQRKKSIQEYFDKLKNESIHLGHLEGKEKDDALKRYYNYEGHSKGIYF